MLNDTGMYVSGTLRGLGLGVCLVDLDVVLSHCVVINVAGNQ